MFILCYQSLRQEFLLLHSDVVSEGFFMNLVQAVLGEVDVFFNQPGSSMLLAFLARGGSLWTAGDV